MLELDANFLVALLRGDVRASEVIHPWFRRRERIHMSSVAWSEFLCGPLLEEEKEQARLIVTTIESFTVEDATLAADLFNSTGRRSRSHSDCMIAASAIRRRNILATFDRTGFERFVRFKLKLASA